MKSGPYPFVTTGQQRPQEPQESFQELEAIELYCPKCGRAVPVRRFLLLVLPDGDK
ncbi:MAG: hypothetical protein JRH04_15915, partial [Deltaproteobacteria bacterium]|nr:hypothetical protein [Deltaproteobacteria bacterium]